MENKQKAVLYMIVSSLSFAVMGSMVKLSGDIPVFEKVFFRNFISLFLALGAVKKAGGSLFGKRENQKYLLARSLLGLSGVVLYFYAIGNMYLADSSMLNKLSPFFTTLFAWLFLKEKLPRYQIPALTLVFGAALLIIKPSFSFDVIPALSGFLSAIAAGSAYTLVRFLRDKENPSTIVFYFSFISVVGIFPLMVLNFKVPSPEQLIYLLGTGLAAASGQFGITLAYGNAPATKVSIYDYLNIVFASILGFSIWHEVPDHYSIIGGLIIVLIAISIFIYENKRSPLPKI